MSKRRLKRIMSIQSTTFETQDVDDFIYERFLEISDGDEDNFKYHYEDGNSYITKGNADTYPCVVAHTDTVHDIHKNFKVFVSNGIMFAMDMDYGVQAGIGGDDKVGIYIAMEMLKEIDTIKVAFFRDEEHGCLGSKEAKMDWFEDVEFVFQCDRQGYKDFVNTIFGQKLFDKAFSTEIADVLGRYNKVETTHGGLTDVYQLVENGLNVCVANISCGYHRPHSDDEVIVLSEVFLTRDFVYELIMLLKGKKWVNSEFVPYVPYQSKLKKLKAESDWGEWDEKDHDYPKTFSTYDDLYGDEKAEHELSNFCFECASPNLTYDPHEDADWCYDCAEYTTYYDTGVKEDELVAEEEELTDEDYNTWLD